MKLTQVPSSQPFQLGSPPRQYGSTAFPQRLCRHSFLCSTSSVVRSSKASQLSHGMYGHGVSSKTRKGSDPSTKKRRRGNTLTRASWYAILDIMPVSLDWNAMK